MKSKLISAAVLSVAALTSLGASAQIYNSWMFDQMAAPASKTRAEVKAEVRNAAPGAGLASGSAYNGATAQQNLASPVAEKAGSAPQASSEQVKTSQ